MSDIRISRLVPHTGTYVESVEWYPSIEQEDIISAWMARNVRNISQIGGGHFVAKLTRRDLARAVKYLVSLRRETVSGMASELRALRASMTLNDHNYYYFSKPM